MSKRRPCAIHIWFLDNDLSKSAQMLSDKCLRKTIDGCIGAITSVCMYLVGIRSSKVHAYMFSKENAKQTLDDKFSGWPLKKNPSFGAVSWKESKWCRMCHENYNLAVEYLSMLFDEHLWRHSSMHPAYSFLDWASCNTAVADFPYAGLKDIVLPWKSVDPRFRSIDIVEGYRRQYCATQIDDGDPFIAYAKCKRDIPEFVVDAFSLSTVFEH